MHSSGIDNGMNGSGAGVGGSGISDMKTNGRDSGTINVDVMGVQPDDGLIVSISEAGKEGRSAEPATCVVYGTTYYICESEKKVNTEELELLRLLGRNFGRTKPLDANKHWQYTQTSPQGTEVTDYTVKGSSGNTMSLEVARVFKLTGGYTAATNGKITYDSAATLPKAVSVDTISRTEQGMGTSNRSEIQIDLNLASDSLASAGSK